MSVICIVNQKGGVGKTTTCRELSINIANRGKKILVVDTDPQANLTKSLTDEEFKGLYEALMGNEYELKEVKSNLYLLSLVPSS